MARVGVSDDCFGVCVAVERRFIDNTPFVEIPETTLAKLGIVAMGKIAAQLVYGDLQYETGFFGLLSE